MPLYDYVCANCGHEVEVMHSVNDHGPTVCPVCGGPMKKAIVAPAVHFKGSGWARKERSGSNSAKPSRSSSDSDSGSGPSGGSSGDSSSSGDGTEPKAEQANSTVTPNKDPD